MTIACPRFHLSEKARCLQGVPAVDCTHLIKTYIFCERVCQSAQSSPVPRFILLFCDSNRELPGGSESGKFESDPLAFLKSTYGTGAGAQGGVSPVVPDLAVMYDTHLDLPGVADYLRGLGLETAQVVFNAHVNGDADSDDTHRSVAVLEKVYCQPGAGGGLEGRL